MVPRHIGTYRNGENVVVIGGDSILTYVADINLVVYHRNKRVVNSKLCRNTRLCEGEVFHAYPDIGRLARAENPVHFTGGLLRIHINNSESYGRHRREYGLFCVHHSRAEKIFEKRIPFIYVFGRGANTQSNLVCGQ